MKKARDRSAFFARMAEEEKRWKAEGLCCNCGRTRANGSVQCVRCLEKRRRAHNERIDIDLECASCGGQQTEPLLASAIMSEAVARVKCLACGTKTMRRRRAA